MAEVNDAEFLKQLDPALRAEVADHFRTTLFRNWDLALIAKPGFLTNITVRMKREVKFPGEYVSFFSFFILSLVSLSSLSLSL